MIEEEAVTKWCSEARVDGVNRDQHGKPDPRCLCIASDCMKWVWEPNEEKTVHNTMATIKVLDPVEGHCGLVK